MSEVIYYCGDMEGVEPEEWEETLHLIFCFQNAQLTFEDKKNKCISFEVKEGWRGAGLSCEEILQEHFKEFCIKHPHIDLKINAIYVEHAPVEEYRFKGEKEEKDVLL